jgi:ribonuclease E
VRTAAEGAAEAELDRDITRLAAQWENIEKKAKTATAPALLYGEPDLTIRVIRDVFNEDFSKLIVSGDDGWEIIDEYVRYVAPHLADRISRWDDPASETVSYQNGDEEDVFAAYRIDEQLAKALERKVWLPSGGSLVIDRTEAMTVIDVNTGKFTGQGGNLEETVTRNNLEAAEEIVRQLRLRDVGGIVVIDFIDMVLEANRELVLRRLLECLARDRTKHQVAEVTSLGLVQMTRKRVGAGLLEAFSQQCECCNGRGVIITLDAPAEPAHRASAGTLHRPVPTPPPHVPNGNGNDNGNGKGQGNGSASAKPAYGNARRHAAAGPGRHYGPSGDRDHSAGFHPGGHGRRGSRAGGSAGPPHPLRLSGSPRHGSHGTGRSSDPARRTGPSRGARSGRGGRGRGGRGRGGRGRGANGPRGDRGCGGNGGHAYGADGNRARGRDGRGNPDRRLGSPHGRRRGAGNRGRTLGRAHARAATVRERGPRGPNRRRRGTVHGGNNCSRARPGAGHLVPQRANLGLGKRLRSLVPANRAGRA